MLCGVMEPIYILGAGPAGLAAAYALTKQGVPVVVVERDAKVGGLAKSIEYKGFILDFGPHRFYTKLAPVLKLWDEVLGKEQVTVNRLTRIYYGRKYFSYPIKAVETLVALGLFESTRIVFSYLQSRLFPKREPKNFAEWVTAKFGQRLYEIFFEGYTQKLWGIPCTEISADWASQRIKGLSLSKAIRNALLGNDGKTKTLIDQFQFPRLGSGQLYEKIGDYVRRLRQQLLGLAVDPGTFFVKTVSSRSANAAYDQNTFYEAWRVAIQRYGIYNPYTGLGAIPGRLPHGPHNIRDVLATHVLKQTGSYEQASYAIQDTAEMVAQHYGRFLPQDKAEIAARVLNRVWEAA